MRRHLAGLGMATFLGISASACGVGGPTSLQTGDCVNYQTVTDGEGGQSTQKVATPCAQPHDGEVFLVFTMPGATFPGYFAIGDAQQDECGSAFKDYVGVEWEQSKYTIDYESPDQNTWATGNHQIVCTLVDGSNAKLTGSAKNSNR
jgi:hypothetical protein